MNPDGTVEGRSCGTCNLCCKILNIPELDKPANVWCRHCNIGVGCGNYDNRPDTCRQFFCHYMRDPTIDERWHPATARFLMCVEQSGNLVIQVDPQRPDAWKREPYYSAFRRKAQTFYPQHMMFAKIGARAFLILPDRDEDLGICGPNDRVTLIPKFPPSGMRWDVKVERGVR